jgi:Protein of unknown function (DUF4240)
MDNILRVKSSALNAQLTEDIRKEVGQLADVEIKTHLTDDGNTWLTEDRFWEMIEQLDWSKEGDDEAVVAPIISILISMPLLNTYRFQDILSEKLWLLDTQAHAAASLDNPDSSISSDGFLYDRCCVVANGKAFYESVLANPLLWPKGLSFEALLYVASDAYKQKTRREFTYLSTYNYETGSNE